MDIIESSKRLAAYTAVDNHIKPEHKVREMSIDWVITLTVGPNRSSGSVLVRSKAFRGRRRGLKGFQAQQCHMWWSGLFNKVQRRIRIVCSFRLVSHATTLYLFFTHRCARFPVEGIDSFLRLGPWRCRSIPYNRRDAGWR